MKFRFFQYSLALAIILLVTGCYRNNKRKEISLVKYGTARPNTVTHIVDGDTFDMTDSNGKIIRIRPIGINADEMKDNDHGSKGPYARAAKDFLTGLIYNKTVRIETDVKKTDQYKRVLAYVFVDDTVFVNAEMVKQGYAMIETHPPNVKYADLFYLLQTEARENKRGMWQSR
ncbi:MAG: thermonuclease family protein [Bacteroidetes bacterium]|nr:thermonuclease family protein [Bacteroidota bacterium]